MKIRDDFLPYSKPYITGREFSNLNNVINSGWWSKGEKTKEFEDKICEYTGVKYGLAVSSCTAALFLLCKALGFSKGDEVITTPITFCSTVNVVVWCGATPIFCDINQDTGVMDTDKLEGLITPKTKGIIAVHYSGSCVDMDKVNFLARKYNLKVIEDSAHGLGSFYKGKHSGNFSQGAALSFYATKNLSTGEGGMLLTNNKELYNKAANLHLHGMNKNAYTRYKEGGSWKYDVTTAGYKYNFNDILASIGLAQLEKFPLMQEKRETLKNLYDLKLKPIKEITLLKNTENTINSNHLYIIKVKEHYRDLLIEKLNEYKIGTSVHFIPVHHMSFYKDEKYNLKNADMFFKEIISLPLYPSMKEKDVNYVADALWEITSGFSKFDMS